MPRHKAPTAAVRENYIGPGTLEPCRLDWIPTGGFKPILDDLLWRADLLLPDAAAAELRALCRDLRAVEKDIRPMVGDSFALHEFALTLAYYAGRFARELQINQAVHGRRQQGHGTQASRTAARYAAIRAEYQRQTAQHPGRRKAWYQAETAKAVKVSVGTVCRALTAPQ
jgi:hypothetical protein